MIVLVSYRLSHPAQWPGKGECSPSLAEVTAAGLAPPCTKVVQAGSARLYTPCDAWHTQGRTLFEHVLKLCV